ncbi:MAG: hypothetical protein ABR79_00580 [Cryomorphaceae bacterium BACL11 MAG-121001-bin54]|nr:MAG: hypothetical protein ABR79_00580 [Cryomorphaceae bacterium BACL11 MAG-121001-bin54]
MEKSIIFSCILFFALAFFSYNLWKIVRNIRLGKSKNRFDQPLKRTKILLKIAFGQTKLFARPASGILHAIVYWGFLVITIGTLEMMVDGIFNLDRSFGEIGDFIIQSLHQEMLWRYWFWFLVYCLWLEDYF